MNIGHTGKLRLKTRIILTFVPVVTVLIVLIGGILSELISGSIKQQGEQLVRQSDMQLSERMAGSLKTYQQLLHNRLAQIRSSVRSLGNSDEFRGIVKKSQHDTIILKLSQALVSDGLDFATVFDLDGHILASTPTGSDDLALTNDFRSTDLSTFLSSYNNVAAALPDQIGLLEVSSDMLRDLGIGGGQNLQSGSIAMVVASVIENDFGDKLGVLVLGKLLDQWDQGLDITHDLFKTAFAVFAGTGPLASIGFTAPVQGMDASMLANNPTANAISMNHDVGGTQYSFLCQPLRSIHGRNIGGMCASISSAEATKARSVLHDLAATLAQSVQTWLFFIGSIAIISLILLSIFIAQKIADPLSSVTDAMKELAEDNLDISIPDAGNIEEVATMTAALGVFRDNAVVLRQAQDSLVRQERLAVLGKLAATVSHELRNPLGTIRTSMITIADKTHGQRLGIEKAIERIERNILRCDRIIAEMLDYTRETTANRLPTNVDQWLEQLLEEQEFPAGILIRSELASNATAAIDQERLRRAVINVIDNACHAVQEREVPHLREVKIGTQIDDRILEIVISDTGNGIPDETFDKIFEPLFSTRSFGVGLGLPVVRKIMEEHNGGIRVSSITGNGTTVTLWLPVTEVLQMNGGNT